uniref:Uncharacterized protein n=1 Tax=Sphaerodactylus townsendi TaxID=933632 RepID=A0ACB8E4P2_9SAUR
MASSSVEHDAARSSRQVPGPSSNAGGGDETQQMAGNGAIGSNPEATARDAQVPANSAVATWQAAPPADLAEILRVAIDKALTAREMAQQGDRATNQRPHCSNRPTHQDVSRGGRYRNPLSFPDEEEEGSDTEGIEANDRFSEAVDISPKRRTNVSSAQGKVLIRAYVEKYLLEKSRLVYQEHNERNYHVFYYLLAGASEEERSAFHLKEPEEYHYLNQMSKKPPKQSWDDCYYDSEPGHFIKSCTYLGTVFSAEGEDLKLMTLSRLQLAMEMVRLSSQDFARRIFSLSSAILHFGNICYKKKKTCEFR